MKLTGWLLISTYLLAPCAVQGQNICLDETSEDYRCIAGTTELSLMSCGLVDDDFPAIAQCLESVGRMNIVGLRIDRNNFSEPPSDLFSGLTNLEDLTLVNTLKSIPSNLFSGLGNLKFLFCRSNDLTEVDINQFAGLTNLDTLNFGENSVAEFPAGLFSSLGDNLSYLDIGGNLATEFPLNLFSGLSNLQTLSVRSNKVSGLEAGIFSGLDNLETLRIEDMGLTELEVGLFAGLNNLKILYCYENELTTLPDGIFASLSNVEELWIDDNELRELPENTFSGLELLRWLRLQFNDLIRLPVGIFSGLANLSELDLVGNYDLQCVPRIGEDVLIFYPSNFNEDSLCDDDLSFCSMGVAGVQNGNICCPEECGACGGTECKSRPGGEACCTRAIGRSGVLCSETASAPCIIDFFADDRCSNTLLGVKLNDICCSIECGTCGGQGCARRPGGSEKCCSRVIEDSNVLCSESESAPCIIDG